MPLFLASRFGVSKASLRDGVDCEWGRGTPLYRRNAVGSQTIRPPDRQSTPPGSRMLVTRSNLTSPSLIPTIHLPRGHREAGPPGGQTDTTPFSPCPPDTCVLLPRHRFTAFRRGERRGGTCRTCKCPRVCDALQPGFRLRVGQSRRMDSRHGTEHTTVLRCRGHVSESVSISCLTVA